MEHAVAHLVSASRAKSPGSRWRSWLRSRGDATAAPTERRPPARGAGRASETGHRVVYIDTSFLVPLVLRNDEQPSRRVGRLPAQQLAVSHWTRVEFSLTAYPGGPHGCAKTRSGAGANPRFEALLDESFVVLLPNVDDSTWPGGSSADLRTRATATLFTWPSRGTTVPRLSTAWTGTC